MEKEGSDVSLSPIIQEMIQKELKQRKRACEYE